MFLFIIGIIVGVVLDNMFAPKVHMQDGKITFEWTKPKNKV